VSLQSARPPSSRFGGEPGLYLDVELRGEDDIALHLRFDPQYVDTSAAELLATGLTYVLSECLSAPAHPIRPRELLSPHEVSTLSTFEQGPTVGQRPTSIVDVLRATSRKFPDRPAIERDDGSTISYLDLLAQVNMAASRLIDLGLKAEQIVAVWSEPTYEAILVELAVLHAGAAFLPLDPRVPSERLEHMMRDSQARLLVEPAPTGIDQHVIPKLRLADLLTNHPIATDTSTPVNRDQLAYVIYTSGSTGVPKGVMVSHGALANSALAAADVLDIRAASRVLQFASLSFDIAVGEIFGTLAAGGTVVLPRPAERVLGIEFSELLRRRRISHSLSTPSVWRTVPIAELPDLAVIMAGGETVPPELAERWESPTRRFANAYGPTETTFMTTLGDWRRGAKTLPIGTPIPGYRVMILDGTLQRVPPGDVGELYIGGLGVARGYIGQPGLTADRFMPDPTGSHGERIYRTGDRVRFDTQGRLEFIGRADSMVKVRGFRIEPGEVEAALNAIEGVENCAVVDEVDDGQTRLVAYCVTDEGVTLPSLRAELERRLPRHLVPERLRSVPSIPLNTNGKADRQALRSLAPASAPIDPTRVEIVGADQASGASLEEQLRQMWVHLLDRPVGPDDDFFAAGGHSLLALKLQSMVQAELHHSLRLTDLFDHSTPRRLAQALRESSVIESPLLVPLTRTGTRAPFFCVHPSGGDVHSYMSLARALGEDQPFYALRDPQLAGMTPAMDLATMARDYIEAARTVEPTGPLLLGGWSMGGIVALEMARQLDLARERVGAVIAFDSSTPEHTNLSTSPPSRGAALLAVVRRIESLEGRPFLKQSGSGFLKANPAEQLREATRICHESGLLPPDSGPDAVLRQLDVVDHHESLLRKHRFVPFNAPLTLLLAEDEPRPSTSRLLGWEKYMTGPIETVFVPGDHLTMMSAKYAASLARVVEHALAEGSKGRG
jgi:amino acid adenylation domain-containing protein